MELYEEILVNARMCGQMQIVFQNHEQDISKIIECTCYKALQKIKAIIEDDSLEDKGCFMKIEEIVCVLEDIGSNGGTRHDFG